MPKHTQQWKGKRSVGAPHANAAATYLLQLSVALRETFHTWLTTNVLFLVLTDSLLPNSPPLPHFDYHLFKKENSMTHRMNC